MGMQYQSKGSNNKTYLHKFQSIVDGIDTVGGWVGYHPELANAVPHCILVMYNPFQRHGLGILKTEQEVAVKKK